FLYHHTSTPEIYTLSLHDALPISIVGTDIAQRRWTLTKMVTGTGTLSIEETFLGPQTLPPPPTRHALFAILIALGVLLHFGTIGDRKSTRLNSSHVSISYAVFCLK